MRELRYARDEYETLHLVISLEYGEHFTVDGCACLVFGCMPGVLQRRVVLVYEYRHLLPGLPIGCPYYAMESVGQRVAVTFYNVIVLLIIHEHIVKI